MMVYRIEGHETTQRLSLFTSIHLPCVCGLRKTLSHTQRGGTVRVSASPARHPTGELVSLSAPPVSVSQCHAMRLGR